MLGIEEVVICLGYRVLKGKATGLTGSLELTTVKTMVKWRELHKAQGERVRVMVRFGDSPSPCMVVSNAVSDLNCWLKAGYQPSSQTE